MQNLILESSVLLLPKIIQLKTMIYNASIMYNVLERKLPVKALFTSPKNFTLMFPLVGYVS